MGSVYEASHTRLDRSFAVKVLVKQAASNKQALARFQREARITSGLGHPHIIEVIDSNISDDGRPYIVMERLVGESLDDRISRRVRLELFEVASIIRQATSALHAAHEKGVVHRDLKPENIFLCIRGGRDDYVKLLDFGISKVLGSTTVVTHAQSLVGSPVYMSPEQADERGSEADARADVYAIATVAFETLTGSPPFRATTIPALLYKIVHEQPAPLCTIRDEMPEGLERVLAKALSKDPDDRQPTIKDFWLEFSHVLETEKVAYTEQTQIQDTAWPEARPSMEGRASELVEAAAAPPRPMVGKRTTLSESVGELGPRRMTSKTVGLIAASFILLASAVAIIVALTSKPVEQYAGTVSSPMDASTATAMTADAKVAASRSADAQPAAAIKVDSAPVAARRRDAAKVRSRGFGRIRVGAMHRGKVVLADVIIDGRRAGQTPLRKRLRVGSHRVEVRRHNRRAAKVVRVRRGKLKSLVLTIP